MALAAGFLLDLREGNEGSVMALCLKSALAAAPVPPSQPHRELLDSLEVQAALQDKIHGCEGRILGLLCLMGMEVLTLPLQWLSVSEGCTLGSELAGERLPVCPCCCFDKGQLYFETAVHKVPVQTLLGGQEGCKWSLMQALRLPAILQ